MKKPKPSITEAHIRQKVAYGVEKFNDIIHMKRSLTTRLYNHSQSLKKMAIVPLHVKSDQRFSEMLVISHCPK